MESGNLFSAPRAQLLPEPAPVPEGTVSNALVTEIMLGYRWLGIMGALGVATSIAVVVYMAFQVAVRGGGGAQLIGAAIAVLYAAPAVVLVRTARAMGRFGKDPSALNLVEVTRNLRDFWQLAGSVTVAALGVAMLLSFFMRVFLRSV